MSVLSPSNKILWDTLSILGVVVPCLHNVLQLVVCLYLFNLMPQPSYPPYSAGALTIPRMLVRWLDVNAQNGPLTRTMSYVTLPIFNAPVSWAGYSTIVTTFNSEGPNNFSIKASVAPVNPNYTLCISFIKGGVLTRYLLWQATGSVLPYNIPLYSGQPILKNFRFEVWSTSQGNATQSTVIQMYTSVAGQTDYRYGNDFQLVGNDGQQTSFGMAGRIPIITPTPSAAGLLSYFAGDYGVSGSGGNSIWNATSHSGSYFSSITYVGGGSPIEIQDTTIANRFVITNGSVIGNSTGTILPNTFTISLLLKFNVLTPIGVVFAFLPSANYPFGTSIGLTLDATGSNLLYGDPLGTTISAPVKAGVWYAVLLTYNQTTGAITMSVNGYSNLVYSSVSGTTTILNNINQIGTYAADAFINANFSIANILVYNGISAAIVSGIQTYLTTYYTSLFTLPLTFPVGSTTITN